MKFITVSILSFLLICAFSPGVNAQEATSTKTETSPQEKNYIATPNEYKVGIEDVLDISVLQPEKLTTTVTVSPDGSISFPYIGNVNVKGLVLAEIQNQIQARLADGYMKYPVVSVSLRESRSKKFFVYGEVMKPGTYYLEDKTTVLKAISMAGGFTKYGSSSRVKVLRPKKGDAGYESIKVNINAVMDGATDADILLMPEDMVVVSEGVF